LPETEVIRATPAAGSALHEEGVIKAPRRAVASSGKRRVTALAGRAHHLLVPTALATLGAILFIWRLGASSFFIDEATSLTEARGSFAHLLGMVHLHETSPPTYAIFLHVWLKLFRSHSELTARMPSALAAIALVGAVWYLASLLTDPPTALMAALLTLCSPILLQYAQQARVYAILMLAVTVTAITVVKAVQQSSGRWLAASVCVAVLTISLHYTGWFEVAPLTVWMASRKSISVRSRISYCSVLALAGVAWLPELVGQFSAYAADGYGKSLGTWAGFTQHNVVALLGTPLSGRATIPFVGPIGVGILLATVALLASPRARAAVRTRGLIIGLAVTPIVAILVLGLAGKHVVIPRYATVAVPFLSIAIATATRLLRPRLSVLATGIVLFAMMLGVCLSLSPSSYYPNTGGVIRLVARRWKAGDFLYPDQLVVGAYLPLEYYAASYLPDHTGTMSSYVYAPAVVAAGVTQPVDTTRLTAAYLRARARHDRMWIVADYAGRPPSVRSLLPPQYRALSVTDFAASISLRLVLAVPVETREGLVAARGPS
jgi:mannosyltransferase